jgi:hypothetical protein
MSMDLSGEELGVLMKGAIITAFGQIADEMILEKFSVAVSKVIVNYIKDKAIIGAGTFTAPPGGGPVTGEGIIT